MSNVNYEWTKKFDSKEAAGETAQSFHEALCGNPDYRDSNIVLNWSGEEVTITEFVESATHIHVAEEGGDYILELFKR